MPGGLRSSGVGLSLLAQGCENLRHEHQKRLDTVRMGCRPGGGKLAADGDCLVDGGQGVLAG
jgi:hypothetical protein